MLHFYRVISCIIYGIHYLLYHYIAEQNIFAKLKSNVTEVPSNPAEMINNALTKHGLQKFVIPNNRLKIHELLGAGKE